MINVPHVQFFNPIIKEMKNVGFELATRKRGETLARAGNIGDGHLE